MKVVLVNSPLFAKNERYDSEDYLPPIGLGLIATYLKQNNIQVEIIDSVSLNLSDEELHEIFREKLPDFLGFNIFTTNYEIVKNIVESINFTTHILIGGPATKELYPELLKWRSNNRIDIVIGDGEWISTDIVPAAAAN